MRNNDFPADELTAADMFAMVALTGLLATREGDINATKLSNTCYVIAGAMLAARSENKSKGE